MTSSHLRYKDVKGYTLGVRIGGGGFSTVYMASNRQTSTLAACKVIALFADPGQGGRASTPRPSRKELEKEVKVHRSLKHTNILEFLDASLVEENTLGFHSGLFVLLELASGGDLFDKIAPDYGIEDDLAHFYFHQLLLGIEYMHSRGIAHRDIKPENLLLDSAGTLKISDFGLCSVFKLNGQERKLAGRCGSLPYIAPELNEPGNYAAEPVDIWGAGVVLFTLLCGNTPWDEPTTESPEYTAYLTGQLLEVEPWTRIGGSCRDLMLRLLDPDPRRRISMKQLWQHPWCQTRPSQLMGQAELARRLVARLAEQGEMEISEPSVPLGVALSRRAVFQQDIQDAEMADSQQSQDFRSSSSTTTPIVEPSLSQFTQTLGMLSQQTQNGTRIYAPELTRCFSLSSPTDLLPILHAIVAAIPDAPPPVVKEGGGGQAGAFKIKFAVRDRRGEALEGALVVTAVKEGGGTGSAVVMKRVKGDPLEWRKLWTQIRDHESMIKHVYRS